MGTDEAKSLVTARLSKSTGPGAVHLPDRPWCNDEFIAQLTSERIELVRHAGQTKRRWVQIRDRNEALDLLCYATHAMRWVTKATVGLLRYRAWPPTQKKISRACVPR